MPVDDVLYPASLVVAGKRCVVVGGGSVAARKTRSLLDAGADVLVIAPEISEEIKALPVKVAERPYRRGDLSAAWLALAATDDAAVNRQVFADGQKVRVWVNVAD